MKQFRPKCAIAIFFFLLSITTNAQWSELGNSNNGTFNGWFGCITADVNGNIYAAGSFINGYGRRYVAKWDGTEWSELGGKNTSAFYDNISSLTTDANGNVYAGGDFKNGNGKYYVAKWDGTEWVELGGTDSSTFDNRISYINIDTNGNVYASIGNLYIAKWNGTAWSELGRTNNPTFFNRIIINDMNGNIYAGSISNSYSKYYVTKWKDSTWSIVGGINDSTFNGDIYWITTDTKGYIYAAGDFTNGNGNHYIAKWNGTAWSELGGTNTSIFNNFIDIITFDSSDNLYVGGGVTNDSGKEYVAKWDGNTWSELGGTNTSTFNGAINGITTDKNGNVYTDGEFENENGYYVAKYSQTNLPVKLSSITATQDNKDIAINWHIATELNTDHFVIQHSTDGSSFTDIGTVKAMGSGANSYAFTDNNPANGINYYRLESADKDGASAYSKVVSVQFTVNSNQLAVYPNPCKENVTILGNHIASVQVIDNRGRVASVQALHDATNPSLSVSGLPAGVYHLRIQTTDGKVSGAAIVVSH